MDLLIKIARCQIMDQCLKNRNGHCSDIVLSQKNKSSSWSRENHQVPEPWSGNLAEAPILFVGSNPSIDEENNELYPTLDKKHWPDSKIKDFFNQRFENIENGIRPKGQKEWVRYWAAARRRAIELFNRPDVLPGKDYALTEVVHCKSKEQKGLYGALGECVKRYLREVIKQSPASIIVILSKDKKVRNNVIQHLGLELQIDDKMLHKEGVALDRQPIEGRRRYLVFLPHPNFRGRRTFRKCLGPRKLNELRSVLQGAQNGRQRGRKK